MFYGVLGGTNGVLTCEGPVSHCGKLKLLRAPKCCGQLVECDEAVNFVLGLCRGMWRRTGLFKTQLPAWLSSSRSDLSMCRRTPVRPTTTRFPLHEHPPLIAQEVNALNRLALEGVLAVIESISRRCGPSSKPPSSPQQLGFWVQQAAGARGGGSTPLPLSGPHSGGLSASLGGPDSSRRGSVSDSDSDQEYIAAFGGGGAVHGRGDGGGAPFRGGGGGGGGAAGELGWLERARARTAEVLQERKKMKRRLGLAARKFNTGTKGWLEYAQVCRKNSVGAALMGILLIPMELSFCRERWGTDKALRLRQAVKPVGSCTCGGGLYNMLLSFYAMLPGNAIKRGITHTRCQPRPAYNTALVQYR